MSETDKNESTEDPKEVDVSSTEVQYQIQCEDVRLISSLLRPLTADDHPLNSSRFSFKIHAYVQKNEAFGHLETQVIYIPGEEQEKSDGFYLSFGLAAKFITSSEIEPTDLADFVRFYTLSLLWPYAREYTSDQLKRAGGAFVSLPIINPQVITERLIEENLVKVEVQE